MTSVWNGARCSLECFNPLPECLFKQPENALRLAVPASSHALSRAKEMSYPRIIAIACHTLACLLFPIGTLLGFQAYTALIGPTFARGVAIGLAVKLIFAVFVLFNGLIALVPGIKVKVILTGVLILANLAYLLPRHPLRALFFAGLAGGLSFAAIYVTSHATRRLAPTDKNT